MGGFQGPGLGVRGFRLHRPGFPGNQGSKSIYSTFCLIPGSLDLVLRLLRAGVCSSSCFQGVYGFYTCLLGLAFWCFGFSVKGLNC